MNLENELETLPKFIKCCVDFLALRLKYRTAKEVFLEKDIAVKEPIQQFKTWLNEACETPEILEPNAFCLSTVSK